MGFKFSLSSLSRQQIVLAAGGVTALSGGCFIVLKTNFVQSVTRVVDYSIISPFKSYVLTPWENGMKRARLSFDAVSSSTFNWASEIKLASSNDDRSFFEFVYEGGKEVVMTFAEWLKELSVFIFEKFIPYLQTKTIGEIEQDFKSYLKPAKHLFTRPNTERIQSLKTRWEQYMNSFSTPGFYESIVSMNKFYVEFKDQLEQLSDEQMAELIDTYLDDPIAMSKKVDIVMYHLGNDQKIKEKFDVELVMDFIRGENIDKIKAKLAASKTSEEVSKFIGALTDLFTLGNQEKAKEVQNDTKNYLEDKLSKVFTNVTSWWNGWAG